MRRMMSVSLVVYLAIGVLGGCRQDPTQPAGPTAPPLTLGWSQQHPSGPQDLRWPACNGIPLLLLNGYHDGGYHMGCREFAIDLVHQTRPSTLGTWVLSAGFGTVCAVGSDATRGNYVDIDHGGGLYTEYCHLLCNASSYLHVGNVLLGGTYLGKIGASGDAHGVPHLHFVVMRYDAGCSGQKRSIPLNGIDGDWNLQVNGVYVSSNQYVAPPGGYNPNSCH